MLFASFLGNIIVLSKCSIVWYKCCSNVTMVTWCHNSTIWCHNSSIMATSNMKYTWPHVLLVGILFEVLRIRNTAPGLKDSNVAVHLSIDSTLLSYWVLSMTRNHLFHLRASLCHIKKSTKSCALQKTTVENVWISLIWRHYQERFNKMKIILTPFSSLKCSWWILFLYFYITSPRLLSFFK